MKFDGQVVPRLGARLHGVVVFVVVGTTGIGHLAEGLGAVVEFLGGVVNVESEARRAYGICDAALKVQDVAVVVRIGDGIGRATAIVTGGVTEVESGEEGKSTPALPKGG